MRACIVSVKYGSPSEVAGASGYRNLLAGSGGGMFVCTASAAPAGARSSHFLALLAGTALFPAVLATLLAAAARCGRLVGAVAFAGLRILAAAARSLILSGAAGRLFRVLGSRGVMRAASVALLHLSRCLVAAWTCFSLGGSGALLWSGRCAWGCGLGP